MDYTGHFGAHHNIHRVMNSSVDGSSNDVSCVVWYVAAAYRASVVARLSVSLTAVSLLEYRGNSIYQNPSIYGNIYNPFQLNPDFKTTSS